MAILTAPASELMIQIPIGFGKDRRTLAKGLRLLEVYRTDTEISVTVLEDEDFSAAAAALGLRKYAKECSQNDVDMCIFLSSSTFRDFNLFEGNAQPNEVCVSELVSHEVMVKNLPELDDTRLSGNLCSLHSFVLSF
jgi:hypothetical protein